MRKCGEDIHVINVAVSLNIVQITIENENNRKLHRQQVFLHVYVADQRCTYEGVRECFPFKRYLSQISVTSYNYRYTLELYKRWV